MIKIKIKKKMAHYSVGQEVNVISDDNGVPLDPFWRSRLKDSQIDGCCEIENTVSKSKEIGVNNDSNFAT